MNQTTREKLERAGKVLLQLIVIVVVSAVAASLATQAAFPRLSNVDLASNEAYWQNSEDSTRLATRPLVNSSDTAAPAATTSTSTANQLEAAFPAPTVSAKSYVIADIATGEVFAEKHAYNIFPIASISKLMTAVVANETIDHTDQVTISEEAAATYGAAGGLRTGDVLTLESLYYPLLLESSNDAATAIAEHANYSRFLELMNRKALVLDMGSTRFHDPSGLADENTSSARDLLQLAHYIYKKKPEIFDITTRTQELAPRVGSDALYNFTNNNPMVNRADFLGGKNGYTDNARHTLLSVFQTKVAGEERDVVIIVLGSESHVADTLALLSWLNRAFE